MAIRPLYFRREDGTKMSRFFVCDTDAEKPASTLLKGDLAYAIDTVTFYIATDSTTWVSIGGSGAYVLVAGDTMTGSLTINPSSGNDALILEAGKRLVFDGSGS